MSRTDFEAAYIERYGHRPRGWSDDFQVYQDAHANGAWFGWQAGAAGIEAKAAPVAYITGQFAGRCVIEAINRAAVLPTGMALYSHPQPSAVPGWKLVPVDPTPEMVSAAEEAHMPFGDMDIALRMAILSAPSASATVQGVNTQLLEALVEITTYPESGQEHELRRIARAAIAAARKGEGE